MNGPQRGKSGNGEPPDYGMVPVGEAEGRVRHHGKLNELYGFDGSSTPPVGRRLPPAYWILLVPMLSFFIFIGSGVAWYIFTTLTQNLLK